MYSPIKPKLLASKSTYFYHEAHIPYSFDSLGPYWPGGRCSSSCASGNRLPDRFPNWLPDWLSYRISYRVPNWIPYRISYRVSHGLPYWLPHGLPDRFPNWVSNWIPNRLPHRLPDRPSKCACSDCSRCLEFAQGSHASYLHNEFSKRRERTRKGRRLSRAWEQNATLIVAANVTIVCSESGRSRRGQG